MQFLFSFHCLSIGGGLKSRIKKNGGIFICTLKLCSPFPYLTVLFKNGLVAFIRNFQHSGLLKSLHDLQNISVVKCGFVW